MKKRIICGTGEVAKYAVNLYGIDNIEFFYDRNENINVFYGLQVVHQLEKISEIQDDYIITIAVGGVNAYSMIRSFSEYNISATWIVMELNTIHVFGKYPKVNFEYKGGRKENDNTVSMLKDMFCIYTEQYKDLDIDFWIYTGDYAHDAYEIKNMLGLKYIFAYNSIYSERGVIPIPDYMCYLLETKMYSDVSIEKPYSNFDMFRKAGEKGWIDSRAFWGGALNTSEIRRMLYHLYLDNKDYLKVNAAVRYKDGSVEFITGKPLPMKNFTKYKYLICVAGYGWADRLKALLSMKRVVLLVDYPYKEYYSDWIKPMVHYVPIKADLSNLIEMIEYLNANNEIYNKICSAAAMFSKEHFNKEKILSDLNMIISKYVC